MTKETRMTKSEKNDRCDCFFVVSPRGCAVAADRLLSSLGIRRSDFESVQSLQLAGDLLNPIVARQGVGPEDFKVCFPVVVEESAMESERAGVGRVNQAGGVAGAHLKEH